MLARSWLVLTVSLALAACSETPVQPLPYPVGGTADTNGAGLDAGATPTSDGGNGTDSDTVGNGDGTGGTDKDAGQDGTNPGDAGATDTKPGLDTTTTTPVANHAGYASGELRVRIVGPSGRGHAVVSGAVVEVAGVLFGNADVITWASDTGANGKAIGAPFFQAGPITLVAGDNLITITAKNKVETVSDSIRITYNPAFTFPDRLRANPRVLKTGKATSVHAVVALGKATTVVKGSVKLLRVDAAGNTVTNFGGQNEMVDDGNLNSSGDEIKGDGLYSKKVTITDGKPGHVFLRASLLVNVGGQNVTAFSDIVSLDVVDPVVAGECEAAMAALNEAKLAAAAAGDGKAGQAAAVAALKASPVVESAGAASGNSAGAWVRFKSGVLGAVNLNAKGLRGTPGDASSPRIDSDPTAFDAGLTTVQLQSKRALMLDPFAQALGPNEVAAATKQMTEIACPAFTVESFTNAKADLRAFRRMFEYGVVALAGHGDAYFKELAAAHKTEYEWSHLGSQEVLWTGQPIACNYFGAGGAPAATCSANKQCGPESECFPGTSECVDHLTADLRRGRVILGSDGTYGVTPAFLRRHAEQPYPRSLVYLGTCRSVWNGSLAGELIAAGAAAVVGYNGLVSNQFATKWGTTFFANLIDQKQQSGVAHVQIEDTANPGTFFSLVGAANLDAAFADIINPSWESGNLQGWLKVGDGRVIAKLGSALPVAGKFMGIISTGLGYTQQTGEIKQKFCIPAGKSKFSFWWKYYSEEFEEYCGSQFQDQFRARFEHKLGTKTVVDVKIDDLCKNGKQFKGLTPADLGFDVGGVYMTPWVESTVDITPFAGNGNVTMQLFTTDAGDGAYDTAILMDKLEFE